ncbi:MAG: hypothetical protein ACN0LA_03930 [Candidatus Longimicrobiales bacterium M2_2A_002]
MDFKDLIYIRYDVRPMDPRASPARHVKAATGKDNPQDLTEEDRAAVEAYRQRQQKLSKALVRFWTWVKDHPDDRDDEEKMICRLDSEMSRSGFPVVDEGITGIGDAFVEVPKEWG